jgi:beta-galactosidase/beta-glucuronidase
VHEYPRPQLVRAGWTSLNGVWDFARDPEGRWRNPHDVEWEDRITVPFAVEAPASGIGDTSFQRVCWYRRFLEPVGVAPGERVMLHFGAVDHTATVWVDGRLAGRHEGGYTPFSLDVTDLLAGVGSHELVVAAEDDPADLAKPRGKQDWELKPHSIWYHRTTGIWQTVWLERLPRVSVARLQWTPDLERFAVTMSLRLDGWREPELHVRVRLRVDDQVLVDDLLGITAESMERLLVLGGGLDAQRRELAWSPEDPVLIDALVEVLAGDVVLDEVRSYTAMRSVGVRDDRFLLNGRPYYLRLVLDQGYWPDGGLTPPDDDALRRDVELVKALGFNGVRKHQKVEDPRYLYWADRLGLLVWAELPSAYRFDDRAVQRHTAEWQAVIERDRSHPCVVTWVTFNESAGLLDLPTSPDKQSYMQGLSLLTRALDPARPVITNDGWEGQGGDLLGVHDYDQMPERLGRRFGGPALRKVLAAYGTHRRLLCLDDPEQPLRERPGFTGRRPVLLTEFGGIALAREERPADLMVEMDWRTLAPDATRLAGSAAWGYSSVGDGEELFTRYAALVAAVMSAEGLAGFCYTQFADTYQEVNGLVRDDRSPKVDVERLASATRGLPKVGGV